MSVDQEHVRFVHESTDGGLDGRELPERKIRWNVREVDLEFSFRDAEHLLSGRVEADRGGKRSVSDVGHIGATERANILEVVLFPHA